MKAAAILVACCLAASLLAQVDTFDLGGRWQLAQDGKPGTLAAEVPGNVHLDLLRAGRIFDPFFRDNAVKLDWIHEAMWICERTFDVPAPFLRRGAVLLRCEGLDTVATIEVNGEKPADTDNMHRTWEFDVKPLLRSGANRITFSPIGLCIKAFQERAPKVPNATGIDIANVRKAPYGNDWNFCAKKARGLYDICKSP